MKCPACKKPLREKNAGAFSVDMCYGGCGGLWFDASELERAVNAKAAATLHTIWQLPSRGGTIEGPRMCPRCPEQVLDRKWFSDAKQVEIDQCPKCGGVWLDDGEFSSVCAEIKQGKAELPRWAGAMSAAVTFVQADSSANDTPPSA